MTCEKIAGRIEVSLNSLEASGVLALALAVHFLALDLLNRLYTVHLWLGF